VGKEFAMDEPTQPSDPPTSVMGMGGDQRQTRAICGCMLQAKVRERWLGLQPMLNAGPVSCTAL